MSTRRSLCKSEMLTCLLYEYFFFQLLALIVTHNETVLRSMKVTQIRLHLFDSTRVDRSWRNMEIYEYKWKWMVLAALGCMNNSDFDKKIVNDILHIVSIFRLKWVHVAPTSMKFYADEGLPLQSYGWSIFLCLFLPAIQAVSILFCTTLDLQLSFHRILCYIFRLQKLHVAPT